MTTMEFPATLDVEYKDISLLLSAMTRRATADASFYVLALAAFGLSYSANQKDAESFFEILHERILSFDSQSTLVAEDAEALGFATHVLIRHGKWNVDLQRHETNLAGYYERIAKAQWLRSPDIATSFLWGFATLPTFQVLSVEAKECLLRELDGSVNGNFPVLLMGLSLADGLRDVDQSRVGKWLERTHLPFKHLCMLAVVLHDLDCSLSLEATNRFRMEVSVLYSSVVDSNISLIRALLAIIHMAAMGENADQIVNALKQFPVAEEVRNRIVSVIRSDARLFIEFREDLLAHPPAIDFLAFYLFAMKRLGLADSYIINNELKESFQKFLKLWPGIKVKAVDQRALMVLTLISFVASVAVILRVWFPFSDWLYNTIIKAVESTLLASILDDILKWAVIFPVYLILGSLLAIWLQGRITRHDISPDGVIANLSAIIQSIRTRR